MWHWTHMMVHGVLNATVQFYEVISWILMELEEYFVHHGTFERLQPEHDESCRLDVGPVTGGMCDASGMR